ncbi:MAG: MMPL family transporter [Acidobacteriota bacterium]
MASRGRRWAARLGPLAIVAGCSALVVWLALGISEIRIRVDDREFLPQSSAVLAVDEEIRQRFGTYERIILGLESRHRRVDDPRFRSDYRFFVERLTENHNIGMLLTDRLYRARFDPRSRLDAPWVLRPPRAEWVTAALTGSEQVRRLAADDTRRTAFLEISALSGTGVRSLQPHIDRAFAALEVRRPGAYRVRIVGRQIVLNALGEEILLDLRRILPWSFLVVFALLWLVFRSPSLALVSVLDVGMAVVCTIGVLQRLDLDLSLMTALVPVLVTALGIADEIHLFGEFFRLRELNPRAAVSSLAWRAARRVFFPVTATTLTTVIGLGSFLATDVPALRAFGLLASIGVIFSWFFTLIFIPVLLGGMRWLKGPEWARQSRSLVLPAGWVRLAPIALSLVILPGILRLRIDDGWTRNFDPEHPVVRQVNWFQEESVGLYRYDLLLERLDGRPWTEPELLLQLARFGDRAASTPRVPFVYSLADLVQDRAWELESGLETAARIEDTFPRPPVPAGREEIRRLLTTYRLFNEEIFVRLFIDRPETTARLMLSVTGDDYEVAGDARRALERLVEEEFGESVAAAFGGSAERGRVLIETVVETQGRSVAASLLLAWIALGVSSGRWWQSLRCLLAVLWALALVLGLAGWVGLELGVASSCFLALGMGVGLDYTIHLAFGYGSSGALGRRVMTNVAVVGIGLSVLLFSSNPTVAKLGLLVVLSMVASGYSAFVFFGRERSREATPAR